MRSEVFIASLVPDAAGRLTRESHDSAIDAQDYTIDYALDLVGNRREMTTTRSSGVQRVTYDYDARDRLFAETGETSTDEGATWSPEYEVAYDYDTQGNQTSKIRTGSGAESDSYIFDVRNRLTGAAIERTENSDPVTIESSYVYDNDGIRVGSTETKTIAPGTSEEAATTTATANLVDHQSLTGYAQTIEERTVSASGTSVTAPLPTDTPRVCYVYGHGLLSQTTQDSAELEETANVVAYFLSDHQGSTRLLTDGAAGITASYVYQAYGVLVAHVGEGTTTHLYTGEAFDATLDLQYNRARYVDLTTGRFLSMDPVDGTRASPMTLPRYYYAGLDPANNIDPTGEFFGAILALAWNLARTGAAITVGSTIIGSVAGAGLYSYAFNASAIDGALYGAQLGASFGAAYSLGGGGSGGLEKIGETAFEGLWPGVLKWILTGIDYWQIDNFDFLTTYTPQKMAQSFFEGFVSGVWSHAWSVSLKEHTSISDSVFGDLAASFVYTIGTQFTKEMSINYDNDARLRIAWHKVIGETVPLWLANQGIDKALKHAGVDDDAIRTKLRQLLGVSVGAVILSVDKLFD